MTRIWLLIIFFALLYALSLVGEANADIYVYRDPRGVVLFTNAPNHSGYRVVIRRNKRPSSSFRSLRRFGDIVRSASDRHGVNPNLVWAVMKVESDFNPQAVSHKGAKGLMQLMPRTARMHNVRDIYDPSENINGGVRHLRLLLDRFQGNVRLALAAYNAGIKAVEQHKNVPPFSETREYVRRVLNYYRRYLNDGGISARREAKQ